MNRRVLFGLAGWLAVAAGATAAGVGAIGVLGEGITGADPRALDRGAVQRGLSGADATPSASGASSPVAAPSTPESEPAGVTRVLHTVGGTVTAKCEAGLVTLLYWTPAQGYRAGDRSERGAAASASVEFKSDDAEYDVTVTCGSGGPEASTSKDDRHGRGHGGRDG